MTVRNRWRRCWLDLIVAACLVSPSALLAENSPAKLLSLRLWPENPTLWGAEASQRFLVLGEYSDGLERDITLQTRFSVSDAKVMKLDENGRVVALADGDSLLTAKFEGKAANTQVHVSGSEAKRPFSFARDIGGIFTKRGCNDSSCHGGVKGQGGFKLSLNALYPKDDYRWIVKGGTYHVLTTDAGAKIPRIDSQEPERSLLLRKATMQAPHGGGQRIRPESADYQTILDWVQRRAPYGEDGQEQSVAIVRVEVYPTQVVLDARGKQQFLVTAHLSNGQREDITDEVLFISNNSEVAKVDSNGRAEAVNTGETAVMIRASGTAVTARVGVISKPIPNYRNIEPRNFIDKFVFAKLRQFNIVPSKLSDDSEFLRRVSLDLTGTLPSPERTREFLASKDPLKRDKVIEALLNTPEYVDYWTFRFGDLFRVAWFQNGMGLEWAEAYWEWIRRNFRENRPYSEVARERIAAVGSSSAAWHFLPNGEVRYPQNKMAEEVRVFLGRRLDCAQCHNHPFEAWSQDQFWGLAAFFGRMSVINGRGEEPGTAIYEDPTGQEVDLFEKGKSRKVLHPRTGNEVHPAFLDGTVLPEEERADQRVYLADWMVSHPYFAEATVNRFWGYFFSKGIVDPVDDFRSTNPPTHPELLDALARDFEKSGYNLKHLMRTIVSSKTYQLSSQPNETNREDRINYSHAIPRLLDAELLFDAISYVSDVPFVFEQDKFKRGRLPPGSRAIDVVMPDIYRSRILEIYGRSMRAMLPEQRPRPNLGQALHRLVGFTFTDNIAQEGGRIDRLIERGASDREIIEELYLLGLTRLPTSDETSELLPMISNHASRRQALEDLLWALLSSQEFIHNH
ncbi:MAG: DUF1549 domain-containing protein [Acidimicrobiia bacterium]|nr:DUF1549 domain-containing protein [Acidimicrobiia bacterium]